MISSRLDELQVGAPFLAIHAGETVAFLTDYFVRRIPDEWNSTVPPDLVDGRHLTPLFVGCDSYVIYCMDNDSHEIIEIDPEAAWPPTNLHKDWNAFVVALYLRISADQPEELKLSLQKLLQLEL